LQAVVVVEVAGLGLILEFPATVVEAEEGGRPCAI
jgi:hypothetical protein